MSPLTGGVPILEGVGSWLAEKIKTSTEYKLKYKIRCTKYKMSIGCADYSSGVGARIRFQALGGPGPVGQSVLNFFSRADPASQCEVLTRHHKLWCNIGVGGLLATDPASPARPQRVRLEF